MNEIAEIALKIGVATLLGGLVGAERQRSGKAAGLRTHMSIAVGATLLAHISHFSPGGPGGTPWDGGRIAAQIVSGIGFIGAGTILHARGAVHGLTTAAALWVSAAVGISVGSGFYTAAAVTTIALLLILSALRPLEHLLLAGHIQVVSLRLRPGQKLTRVMELLEEALIDPTEVTLAQGMGHPVVRLCFRGSADDARRLIQLANLEGLEPIAENDPALQPPEKHKAPSS